ncbi:MAG TPA: hypothetical protein VJ276_06795 [Thermoanaerobaculia bacterium]|nr:hypothetical protein [Thermoanaerobaculia bacterium]
MMTTLRNGARLERYLYDANDERVATVYTGTPQRWRYTLRDLDQQFVREYEDAISGATHAWSWTRDYLDANGNTLATVSASGGREHFHPDHLGTPRLITTDDGKLIARRTLLPYGAEAPGSDDDAEVLKFTGHERDHAPGGDANDLDYMHARFAGSAMRPQRWNRYAYVTGNPINATDPTGAILIVKNGSATIDAIAGEAVSRVSVRTDNTLDTIQLTTADLVNNEGALLLNEMATSANVYTYEEGQVVDTAAGPEPVDGVANLDNQPVNSIGRAKPANQFPPPEVDGAVVVDPTQVWRDSATKTMVVPTAAIAFHELAESYTKVEKNIPWGPSTKGPGAHADAREREQILMRQRPAWTLFPAGELLTRQP